VFDIKLLANYLIKTANQTSITLRVTFRLVADR